MLHPNPDSVLLDYVVMAVEAEGQAVGKCQAASGSVRNCVRPDESRSKARPSRRTCARQEGVGGSAFTRQMLLAGPTATLKGKLTEKVRYRPTAAIEPLRRHPRVSAGGAAGRVAVRSVALHTFCGAPKAEELAEYSVAIKSTAAVREEPHEAGHVGGARHVHGLGGDTRAAFRVRHVRDCGRDGACRWCRMEGSRPREREP